MIIDRYENDMLFAQIPRDYYDLKHRRWSKVPREWALRWAKAHNLILPYDLTDGGADNLEPLPLCWYKQLTSVRLQGPERPGDSSQASLSPDLPRHQEITQFKETNDGR